MGFLTWRSSDPYYICRFVSANLPDRQAVMEEDGRVSCTYVEGRAD